jgi:hypothetical protein
MADKREIGPGTVVVDGETYATETFDYEGTLWTLRELSVDEGDDIFEAAQEPLDPKDPSKGTKTNNRLNTRFLLAKSIVEPATGADRVGKWGGRKYTTMLRAFNKLNSIDDANPTPPAGSAGPTSPDGGDASPTI